MNWDLLLEAAFAWLVVGLAIMMLLWLLAIRLNDVSIIDIWWGPGFAVGAWVAYAVAGDPTTPRDVWVAVLASIWALRLGIVLLARKRGHGEDRRYTQLRKKVSGNFNLWALKNVYLNQGVVQFVVGVPVLVAIVQPAPALFGPVAWIGVAVYAIGLYFEAVGDWQMDRFRADPANKGRIIETGLWRYTRHPNYFGDVAVWTGLALIALDHWTGVIGLIGPVAIGYVLVKITGLPLMERYLMKRPGYAEYAARTSAFIPWFPKK